MHDDTNENTFQYFYKVETFFLRRHRNHGDETISLSSLTYSKRFERKHLNNFTRITNIWICHLVHNIITKIVFVQAFVV